MGQKIWKVRFGAEVRGVAVPTKLPQNGESEKRIVDCAIFLMEQLKNILFLNPEPAAMRGYSKLIDVELKVNASASLLNEQ